MPFHSADKNQQLRDPALTLFVRPRTNICVVPELVTSHWDFSLAPSPCSIGVFADVDVLGWTFPGGLRLGATGGRLRSRRGGWAAMIAVFAVLGGRPNSVDAHLWQSEPARRLLPGVLRKILAS